MLIDTAISLVKIYFSLSRQERTMNYERITTVHLVFNNKFTKKLYNVVGKLGAFMLAGTIFVVVHNILLHVLGAVQIYT